MVQVRVIYIGSFNGYSTQYQQNNEGKLYTNLPIKNKNKISVNRIISIIRCFNRNINRIHSMMKNKPIFSNPKQLSLRASNFDNNELSMNRNSTQDAHDDQLSIDNILQYQTQVDLRKTGSYLLQYESNEDLQLSIIEHQSIQKHQQLKNKQSPTFKNQSQQNKQNIMPNKKKMTVQEIKKNNQGPNCSDFLFCSQIPQKAQLKSNIISFSDFKRKSSNLDILLFKNSNNVSKLQRFLTKSQFDHVAMVVQISNCRFILESDTKNGVCLCNFQKFVQSIDKKILSGIKPTYEIGYRRFINQRYSKTQIETIYQKSQKFIRRVLGKKYKFNPMYLISQQYEKEQQTYFCSQLIAECLKESNLIQFEKPTYSILPRDFSAKIQSNQDIEMEIISDKDKQTDVMCKIFQTLKLVSFNSAIGQQNNVL